MAPRAMRRAKLALIVAALVGAPLATLTPAQQSSAVAAPIEPPEAPLPPEQDSAGVTRFSFIAYGDTRSQVDGLALQPDHGELVARMVSYAHAHESTMSPVRFVVQSGDAVTKGSDAAQWDVSFSPLVGRLTRGAGLPYFFTIGNHDAPAVVGPRALGLRNALSAISTLVPPEGSPRRLSGYPTYAFGFGNLFGIAIDSNIAADAVQLAWVANQLDQVDRARYRHVLVFFHHPIFSSGPHGGSAPRPAAGQSGTGPNGQTMPEDSVELETAALRRWYAPLFRRHHVRLTISGHDHLFDHFVEHYVDAGVTYRRDDIVTGGGGAPIYTYRGEPELSAYLAAGSKESVRVDHLMKPGATAAGNPHHFLVVGVDADRLSVEVFGIGGGHYRPYAGRSRIDLIDP